MQGAWIVIITGGILAVALGIGMAMAFAAPFFAVPIALFLFAAGAIALRTRRAAAATTDETPADHAGETRRRNRPERPDAGEARPSH